MTYEQFENKYNGKQIDYDGAYGVQGVDLIKQYIKDVIGLEPQAIGNAEAYWNRYDELSFLHDNFERIKNTLTFKPQKRRYLCMGNSTLKKWSCCYRNWRKYINIF